LHDKVQRFLTIGSLVDELNGGQNLEGVTYDKQREVVVVCYQDPELTRLLLCNDSLMELDYAHLVVDKVVLLIVTKVAGTFGHEASCAHLLFFFVAVTLILHLILVCTEFALLKGG
jgi:hypothetical protein